MIDIKIWYPAYKSLNDLKLLKLKILNSEYYTNEAVGHRFILEAELKCKNGNA